MKQLPDDMMRQFWQESRKEAPEGFSGFVMQNLPQHTPLPETLKKPLLSLKAAGFLLALLLALTVLLGNMKGDSEITPAWYQPMQEGLLSGLNWLNTSGAILPSLAILLVSLILLFGLDRLLQRFMNQQQPQ